MFLKSKNLKTKSVWKIVLDFIPFIFVFENKEFIYDRLNSLRKILDIFAIYDRIFLPLLCCIF